MYMQEGERSVLASEDLFEILNNLAMSISNF